MSTLLTAVIRDAAGNIYSNALVEASYLSNIPAGTGSGPPLVSGSVFQTFSVSETDSFGNLSMGLTDLALITPAGGSWFFNVLNSTKTIGFSLNSFAITGASVDLTAAFAAASAPLLPASSFINVTINGSESFAEIAAPAGAAGFDRVYGDSTSHRLTVKNNNGPAATLATLSDNLGAFAATTSAQLAGVLSDETGTGSVVFGTGATISPKNLSNIRIASQFAGADGSIKINAADADLGSTEGEIWVDQSVGPFNWSVTVAISAKHTLRFIQPGLYTSNASGAMITLAGTGGVGEGACVIGSGMTSTKLQTNHATADIIQMNGNSNRASDLFVIASATRTGGAGINCKAGGCYFENMLFNPCWNGIQCTTSGAGISGKNFVMREALFAGNWNAGIILGGMASGAGIADCFFSQGQVVGATSFTFADAAIVLDAGIDTVHFSDVDFGGIGSIALKSRFSGGTLDVPRLIRFTACSAQCDSTVNVLELSAYKDMVFDSCLFTLGIVAVHVNGATNGKSVRFENCMFSQTQNQLALIDGGTDTRFLGCTFSGASQSGNGSFDGVLVSAGVSSFYFDYNTFADQFVFANHAAFGIRVAVGASDNYSITNNNAIATLNSGLLSDGGTGLNKVTFPNVVSTGTMITPASGLMQMYFNGSPNTLFGNTLIRQKSASLIGWSSGTDPNLAIADINMTRLSAAAGGVLQIGTGETANANGLILYAGKVGQASIVAATGAINTTETIVVKNVAMPANRIVAGTVIRVILQGTCTATVANTSTFAIRIGTAGTTADGLVFQAVTAASAAAGTTIPFRAILEMTVRTAGAAATSFGTLTLENQGTTGIATVAIQVISATMSAFNTTTANLIVSATYVSAAATTTSTFQQGFVELVYQ